MGKGGELDILKQVKRFLKMETEIRKDRRGEEGRDLYKPRKKMGGLAGVALAGAMAFGGLFGVPGCMPTQNARLQEKVYSGEAFASKEDLCFEGRITDIKKRVKERTSYKSHDGTPQTGWAEGIANGFRALVHPGEILDSPPYEIKVKAKSGLPRSFYVNNPRGLKKGDMVEIKLGRRSDNSTPDIYKDIKKLNKD